MITLEEKLAELKLDRSKNIPYIVKLFRSPRSPLALPGSISQANYHYLCALLNRRGTPKDEAFMMGFCLGNHPHTTLLHIGIFNLVAYYLFPHPFRFSKSDFFFFDLGFAYGKSLTTRFDLIDFTKYKDISLSMLRTEFNITLEDLKGIADYEIEHTEQSSQNVVNDRDIKSKRKKLFYTTKLKIFSSISALAGGMILASNTSISGYGFIFLAISSSQMLIAAILENDKLLIWYSATIFFGVDLLGIYRWLFSY